ncbi:MAG: Cof-type HAD-IIB family hydrolase [Lachnospiraceae bacterium]|nr:Cof-type HAD-IIB family hydrolase [Lachnospiraceae bacterium]
MAIKLVAADMDGTLIHNNQVLTSRTEKAVRDICDKGIKFILNTGRSNSESELYYDQLPMDYSIFANGTYILNLKTGECPYYLPITPEDAKIIYDIYAQFDCLIFIQGDHWVYTTEGAQEECRRFPEYIKGLATIDLPYRYEPDLRKFLEKRTEPVEKFHVSFINHDQATEAYAILKDLPFAVVWCGHYCVEVSNPGADKGLALKWLGEKLGIKREEIMAIGDSGNDRSMIEYAGIGVAMGNSPESIKEIADYVVPSNDEDGAAWALEELLLKKQ